jgi:hypothetical protein
MLSLMLNLGFIKSETLELADWVSEPTAPILSYPAEGQTVYDEDITFIWQPNPDRQLVTKYHIQADKAITPSLYFDNISKSILGFL